MPDYEICLWDTNRFDVNITLWTKEAFAAKKYAFVSDYIRFYALANYGGIYLDSDVEVIKPFDDLLKYSSFFGYEYTGVPEAAIIGCKKSMAWIEECKRWYEDKSYYDKNGEKIEIVAPLIVKYGFEKTYNYKLLDKNKESIIDDIAIFPCRYFSPKNGYTGKCTIYNETYTIHHFESGWLKRNYKVKIKRLLHILLIWLFGKNTYNKLMYFLRRNKH
jgi:hypothetical protein